MRSHAEGTSPIVKVLAGIGVLILCYQLFRYAVYAVLVSLIEISEYFGYQFDWWFVLQEAAVLWVVAGLMVLSYRLNP